MPRQILIVLVTLSCVPLSRACAQPVGAGSGPLSELSRSVKDNSRSVHERGRSVRDGSVGSMLSGPVRGQRRIGMLSGPVSELSVGPVTAGRSMTGGGSMTASSVGAVKQDLDRSLGEQIYDLQRTLGPLQEQLRQQLESGEDTTSTELHEGTPDPSPGEQAAEAGAGVPAEPVSTDVMEYGDVQEEGELEEPFEAAPEPGGTAGE